MSAQPSLLVKAEPAQVILPSNNSEVQVVRDTAAFGLGKYWAYFKNGTRELIGGPGLIPLSPIEILPYSGEIGPNTISYRGFVNAASVDENIGNFTASRSGSLRQLTLSVPVNTFTTPTTFTVRKGAGVGPLSDTTIQIVVPPLTTGQFTFGAVEPFNFTDRISLKVESGASAGGTSLIFSAGLSLAVDSI